ncbi:RagB/SusD family nutrient uptake outer membrane protein [Puia sp. P3]|uniref:RagB/SusD family nutrient uptake outer membrane protein n=1 Tax=Puia sp. P3 TaxID=3423952 RepID=UPI003D6727FB
MRRNISGILGLVLLIGLGGCSKTFINQSNPEAVAVDAGYKTEADITAGVYSVYQALRSSNCVGEGASTWTDDRSDDINTTDNQSNNGEPFQFTAFALVASNSYLKSHWTALYTPIGRANMILSLIDGISFANADTKKQFIGEMKFVRAYMYFNLVREFGDVPLVTERITTLSQADQLTARVKRDTVYAKIIADLKDALNSGLPNVQPAATKGRVSMQAVNALLGQVYLTMGANLDANKPDNLANAKAYLLAAYNLKTFANLSDVAYADVFDVNKKSTNPEIIWQIPYKQGDLTYSSSLAKNNQPKGETLISTFLSQGSGNTLTNDLLKEYETGDLRTNFSIHFGASINKYYISKFRDINPGTVVSNQGGYGGNDWILIRYADIILNIAEVYDLLGDDATAITYINMVRARAQRPDYATMMATDAGYASKYPTVKLAILHERRVELAFEHHRWFDLIRFFNAQQARWTISIRRARPTTTTLRCRTFRPRIFITRYPSSSTFSIRRRCTRILGTSWPKALTQSQSHDQKVVAFFYWSARAAPRGSPRPLAAPRGPSRLPAAPVAQLLNRAI